MTESEKKEKILIVDDTPENIDILMNALKGEYRLVPARSGEKALTIASGANPPDLILLDIMMPEIDGYEACRRLKADEKTKDIPVIFITGKSEVEDETKGFELGAVDYITKPISPPIVRARVKSQIEIKNSRKKLEVLANKLSKYLSPQVYESIFSGERDVKIESYNRYLSVCFTDIVGFTPKSEAMEVNEFTQWVNSYLNTMANITIQYSGTLDKFIGDALMIFFGDPLTLGPREDALQCVKMALDMQARAQEFNVQIRIGIHSGECTVGNFGSSNRMDYTIFGKNVNVASRLESNSIPGKILISDTTFEHIKDVIQSEPRGDIMVKGIENKIMTHWIMDN